MGIKCEMCGSTARFIVNRAVYLCRECFNPNDPDVQQLETEGLIYEEIGGDDASSESE